MSKPSTIYVLVCVEISIDKLFGISYSVEPIGAFNDLDIALNYAVKLEDLDQPKKNIDVAYDVLEFDLNEKPHILTFLEKSNNAFEQSVTEVIIKLMREGLIDQLVGEDGNFYYELTEEGKKKKQSMPKIVKKLFRKNKDEE